MATTQDLVKRLDAGATPALRRLPELTADLQSMLANTNKLVASADSGYGDNSKFHRDLNRMMQQLNDMVQSFRVLADLLARHPEALVRGRTGADRSDATPGPAGAAEHAFIPAALLASCRSPNPVLYTLAPVPGTPRPGGPHIVMLQQISLARYLERPEIVRSSENYRLDVLTNEIWGEPLGAMIGRVLAEDLMQRLPGTNLFSANGAISAPADATVEVNIQRMDTDATGALAFAAQAAVEFTRSHRIQATRNVTPSSRSHRPIRPQRSAP